MNLKYVLTALIQKDQRKFEYSSIATALFEAHQLVKEKKGWPISITYGGVEIADEDLMADFDRRLDRLMQKKNNAKAIENFCKTILAEARERLMPC